MEVWGITGVIGSGKSTAVQYLAQKGFPILDADQVSRIVVDRNTEEGKDGFEKVLRAFGSGILDNLGNLDRRALRKRMMESPKERDTLETILHPLIHKHIHNTMKKWKDQGQKLAFVEGARLVESGFHQLLAGIVLVTAPDKQRVTRLAKRDSMDKNEVQRMFALQDEGFMRRASRVVWDNSKKVEDLQKQIDAFVASRLAPKKT